ncbi:sugar kinase [Pontibacter liquoris]|uniref:sugar kinase n=1 Tax=Pontibacter liquoris TaxID=2905677 RepID=UPI001FA78E9F|nr:sugar kinase [Pontibacter liquoris]
MRQGKIFAFGELLWRLATTDQGLQAAGATLQMHPGGAEANVAASLGLWQLPCSYFTCVPQNELAQKALKVLQNAGVDTSPVLRQGDRMGLYFLLAANGLSTGQVVYDRKYSAFSQLAPGTIDWEQVLQDYTWFHWSAISPALNAQVAAVCKEALTAARKLGLTISVDLNYRNRLWDYGKTPLEVMPELVAYCDVVMGNIWAAHTMLGTPLAPGLSRQTSREDYLAHAAQTAGVLQKTYLQCRHVAFTFRFMDTPQHNLFYGSYHHGGQDFASEQYETFEVLDRTGSGDAFMAGLLYGLYHQLDGQAIVDFASAAAIQKLFVAGDFGQHTVSEIKASMATLWSS